MTNMSGTFLNSGACDAGPQGEGKESPSNTGRLLAAGRDKYQPYPDYKDSGVEWLGDVPNEWSVIAIKRLSRVKRGASPRPIDDPKYFDDQGTYSWVRISDVTASDVYLYTTEQTLSALGSSLSVKLHPGDLFLSIAATVGKPCIAAIDCCIHDGFVFFPDLKISTKFLYYLFSAGEAYKGLGKMGTQLNLNTDTVGDIKIGIGTNVEVETITAFLDYETARIDQLIAKQQQLIELLKEKRQAVISHAVTKGLNPNAPMKDSGVDWLGQVPEHWVVTSLKYFYDNLDYKRIPLSAEERGERQGDYPYYGASGIIDGVDDYLFDEECVLVGEDGANLVMRSTPLAFMATGKYWVNNHAHILRMKDGLSDFWAGVINNVDIRPIVSGSAQPKLTAEAMGNINIACSPSLDERREVMNHFARATPKFDKLIAKAKHQVDLLKERRTALISAAVTGKIDLRGWQPPKREVAA